MPDLTLQDYRQAAHDRGYRVLERPGDNGLILNLLSRVCHPDGDDPYGVWIKEHNGRAAAYCHKCPHPQGDRNVRASLGLPAWEERIHQPPPGANGRSPRPPAKTRYFGTPHGIPEPAAAPEVSKPAAGAAATGAAATGTDASGAAGSPREPYRSADTARRLWQSGKPTPLHPQSPPRRWLAKRNLWWPGLPLPETLAWISIESLGRIHPRLDARNRSGGALIMLLAPPAAWRNAWPELPLPGAVQCLYIDGQGEPMGLYPEDDARTLNKRNYGPSQGMYGLFGVPNLTGPALVAEGAADGLALASRQPAPVLIANGVSGLKQEALRIWLQGAAIVQIYADQDEVGAKDAQRLSRHLTLERVPNQVILMPPGLKDPAAASAAAPPLPALSRKDLAEIEKALQAAHPETPAAEATRQAALILTAARGEAAPSPTTAAAGPEMPPKDTEEPPAASPTAAATADKPAPAENSPAAASTTDDPAPSEEAPATATSNPPPTAAIPAETRPERTAPAAAAAAIMDPESAAALELLRAVMAGPATQQEEEPPDLN